MALETPTAQYKEGTLPRRETKGSINNISKPLHISERQKAKLNRWKLQNCWPTPVLLLLLNLCDCIAVTLNITTNHTSSIITLADSWNWEHYYLGKEKHNTFYNNETKKLFRSSALNINRGSGGQHKINRDIICILLRP